VINTSLHSIFHRFVMADYWSNFL